MNKTFNVCAFLWNLNNPLDDKEDLVVVLWVN